MAPACAPPLGGQGPSRNLPGQSLSLSPAGSESDFASCTDKPPEERGGGGWLRGPRARVYDGAPAPLPRSSPGHWWWPPPASCLPGRAQTAGSEGRCPSHRQPGEARAVMEGLPRPSPRQPPSPKSGPAPCTSACFLIHTTGLRKDCKGSMRSSGAKDVPGT